MTKSTLVLPVDPDDLASGQASLERAAQILLDGGTVAFPTETVYGLGANALSEPAVEKIFQAKQRPSWDPLIVHVATEEMLLQVVSSLWEVERSLIERFWPGPLTLLLPKNAAVPSLVTAGRPKVGARMPAHPVARALIELAGVPVAAPSANSFGRISPTTAQHVLEDLDGRIDAILDGGPTSLGLESTVIDASATPPTLYRHGMISIEELRRELPSLVAYDESALSRDVVPAALPSPGVGLRHYAPRAKLVLIEGRDLAESLREAINEASERPIGILLPDDFQISLPPDFRVARWGRWDHYEELAQQLFGGLRALDSLGVAVILCPLPTNVGIGAALRDRLMKASKQTA
jgi:L-threonylcarbamoyladenylate synthase